VTTRSLTYRIALIALPFIVYANGYHHSFQLDDQYTIVSNTAVRSLRNVRSYFVDPATYTSVREQADYRPILQTTYALDYALSKYDMPWWHATQIILHIVVTLGLFTLCRRLLELLGDQSPDAIAFAAAAIFAIHPAASGVVNYLNARSSLLTAAFLLPAIVAYMGRIEVAGYARPQWRTAILYALALFTKVEAIGALGVLWAYELWQRHRESDDGLLSDLISTFDSRTFKRLWPALAITAIYFAIRAKVMAPFPFDATRHAADVGAKEYFITQLTAWWYYVLRWIAPVRLVADYLAYPVYRSWLEPVVLLSLGGWLVIASLLVASWRRVPVLTFLAISALALLSPTSSIAPLAEMVNEHRPYLPIGILSLALMIPIGRTLRDWPTGGARRAILAGSAVIVAALGLLTLRRNEAFATERSYWADVLEKAPSARAYLNYGVALMSADDLDSALRQIQRADDLAPTWYFPHINLGIIKQTRGQIAEARAQYDSAVMFDAYSGHALTWRGEFHLSQGEFSLARDDFLKSMPITLDRYRNAKGLAAAYRGLGDEASAQQYVNRMFQLDSASAMRDVAVTLASSSTLTAQQTAMTDGLRLLQSGNNAAAADVFRRVIALNPAHYGAHYQLAVALDRLGKKTEARTLWTQVLEMAQRYNDQNSIMTAKKRLAQTP